MFNKKKEQEPRKIECPWNKQNGYVIDYTFSTRLFSFLLRNYKSMSNVHPMDEEEFEYLIKSAAKLKIWQMNVPSSLNNTYFNNLKGLPQIDPQSLKYLNAIGCPNALDVDKWKNDNVADNSDKECSVYDGVWIAVDEDGTYRAFIGCPRRKEDKEMIDDPNGEVEEDYHGHFWPVQVWSGKYIRYWQGTFNTNYDRGTKIDKEELPNEFQNMTWNDEPKVFLT